ncbi:MAG: malonic semialdehyde reductase [Alphaproteobacteria bacterium]
MGEPLSQAAIDTIFLEARTQNAFTDKPVSDETLHALYDLYKWGPTSANCEPMRVLFVRSDEGKARLLPHLMEGNQAKTKQAPVAAVIGFDTLFYKRLPELFPHDLTAETWFAGEENTGNTTAFRNGTLQGAYLMIAARSLGLDCGPMSGFDNAGVDAEFWPDGQVKSNFICNLGYGDPAALFDRSPRLPFGDACTLL